MIRWCSFRYYFTVTCAPFDMPDLFTKGCMQHHVCIYKLSCKGVLHLRTKLSSSGLKLLGCRKSHMQICMRENTRVLGAMFLVFTPIFWDSGRCCFRCTFSLFSERLDEDKMIIMIPRRYNDDPTSTKTTLFGTYSNFVLLSCPQLPLSKQSMNREQTWKHVFSFLYIPSIPAVVREVKVHLQRK